MMFVLFLMTIIGDHKARSSGPPQPKVNLTAGPEFSKNPDIIPGKWIVSLRLDISSRPASYIGPGTRIDLLVSKRFEKKIEAFPLLLDVAIVEIKRDGMCSISVDQTQALLIELALLRKCDLSIYLRNPEETEGEFDKFYDSEAVLRYLANKGRWSIPGRAEEEMPVPRSTPR